MKRHTFGEHDSQLRHCVFETKLLEELRLFVTPKIGNKHICTTAVLERMWGYKCRLFPFFFWLCPKNQKILEDVHLVIIRILDYSITKKYFLVYFSIMAGNVVSKKDRYLLKILLAACKKRIMRKRQTDPPTQDKTRNCKWNMKHETADL